jgi:diadenosine tetraphosphate (Ap4A) HIT family hydrolase
MAPHKVVLFCYNFLMEDYSKYEIKDYEYWTVYVHANQGYLGRCYVWCKREDALDLPDATNEEQQELFIILRGLEQAILNVFKADMLNYAFLGNETHHLHGHVIPRYSNPFDFEGVTFVDNNWGHNYNTDKDFTTSPELLQSVMTKLKENLV